MLVILRLLPHNRSLMAHLCSILDKIPKTFLVSLLALIRMTDQEPVFVAPITSNDPTAAQTTLASLKAT